MADQAFRLERGGLIDRGSPVEFSFDGVDFRGYRGDTVASALLANGIHLVGRSFKYHRPRGIFAAGVEEPNALVEVNRGRGRIDPNQRATEVELVEGLTIRSQNCWPSLRFDVGQVNDILQPLLPAGFYYKTFKWPGFAWRFYEENIRRVAGLGRAPSDPDPDCYAQRYDHCELLIVGGGLAGLAAAQLAAKADMRVILIDDQVGFGGWIRTTDGDTDLTVDGLGAIGWIEKVTGELAQAENFKLLTRTRAVAYYDHNLVCLVERVTDHLAQPNSELPRERLWKVRAKTVILATGAVEKPLLFENNDRPGILLADSARRYVSQYSVAPGHQCVVYTNNDTAYEAVSHIVRRGVQVRAVVDSRNGVANNVTGSASLRGIRLFSASTVKAVIGRQRVKAVTITVDGKAASSGRDDEEILECDTLLVSGGWNPNVALFAQSRGTLRFDPELESYVPEGSPQDVWTVGSCHGLFDAREIVVHVADTIREVGKRIANGLSKPVAPLVGGSWLSPATTGSQSKLRSMPKKIFVDFQNDVTMADLQLAVQEGYRSIEHVKRYTTTGMGTDQGRTSSVNAIKVIASELDERVSSIGTTTFRAPYTPVTIGALVGANCGDSFDPVRHTPMHWWAKERGAVFEDVGQWKRARFYPEPGEILHTAVQREAKAVRTNCGLLDASTLGKIDVQGPDSAEFLDRIYTNAFAKLGVGRCRYGLILHEDGMVFDDGVVARLSENHFHVTTTTGGASRVYAWFERWLQTEWTQLRVFCTLVTEQWATMTVSGPTARSVVERLVDPLAIDPMHLPHMAMIQTPVAGVPGRISRISFTGELSFELNVPSDYGLYVWQAVVDAGSQFEITVYGTETMHLLRAEKGFIIVGQETDGSVTPHDLGMDWIVSKKKTDFIGKRSLVRSDILRSDRKQLVGLESEDPEIVLEEGAHIVEDPGLSAPVPMLGHVTSSYFSPNLGRSIALALLKSGTKLKDRTLFAPQLDGDPIAVRVVDPTFIDPEGRRLHG